MNDIDPAPIRSPDVIARGFRWLLSQPLLLIVIAHTVFSMGIWNARDGYGEDTGIFLTAYSGHESLHHGRTIYGGLASFFLTGITSDPVLAATLLKYLSSLLATVAMYLTLSRFAAFLRPGAIILATLAWISCSLDAPYLQSTWYSLFTFGVMLFGVHFLLRRESPGNLIAFFCLGFLAASMRPEYYLPVVLITLILLGTWIGMLRGKSRLWIPGGLLLLAIAGTAIISARPPAWVARKVSLCNSYLLFGFGQCYADYYHRTHPWETFSPMTEYKEILATQFGNPSTLGEAIKHNPKDALGYFWHNSLGNLGAIPGVLLNFRDNREIPSPGAPCWTVIAILATGGLLGFFRLYQNRGKWKDALENTAGSLAIPNSAVRKILFLVMLAAASMVSILVLVGTPRYFITIAPLFYLALAFCADLILKSFRLVRYEPLIIAAACIVFCSPNYLVPRPNHEFDAIRCVIPYVRTNPLIAAWWADPDVAFGFRGNARAISTGNPLLQEEVTNGSVDILMIDGNFRSTKVWADHRDYYEDLERQPEKFGFKKLTGVNAGRFDIYYRQKS